MKITICGSITYVVEMDECKQMLEKLGHEVQSPPVMVPDKDKNGIKNYIGANTLLEMGLAFHLNKKIFLLNPVPEISYKEEILGMKPIVLNGNVELIK